MKQSVVSIPSLAGCPTARRRGGRAAAPRRWERRQRGTVHARGREEGPEGRAGLAGHEEGTGDLSRAECPLSH